jgi:hypothetical protein
MKLEKIRDELNRSPTGVKANDERLNYLLQAKAKREAKKKVSDRIKMMQSP